MSAKKALKEHSRVRESAFEILFSCKAKSLLPRAAKIVMEAFDPRRDEKPLVKILSWLLDQESFDFDWVVHQLDLMKRDSLIKCHPEIAARYMELLKKLSTIVVTRKSEDKMILACMKLLPQPANEGELTDPLGVQIALPGTLSLRSSLCHSLIQRLELIALLLPVDLSNEEAEPISLLDAFQTLLQSKLYRVQRAAASHVSVLLKELDDEAIDDLVTIFSPSNSGTRFSFRSLSCFGDSSRR